VDIETGNNMEDEDLGIRDQYFENLLEGYRLVWLISGYLLSTGLPPTVQNVKTGLDNALTPEEKEELLGISGFEIEYALDALLDVTNNVWEGKHDGWSKNSIQSELDAIPATPLDDIYDIAWFMCVDRGHGT
jgi:hypothetical protein